jgi:hypothetical protein
MRIRSRIFLGLATGAGALLLCAAIALATFGVIAFIAVSEGRDNGQYAHVSKDVKNWIERLTDQGGTSCCLTGDAVGPVEWEISANHYRVKINGRWIIVPNNTVIKGHNRLGYAVVWLYHVWSLETDVEMTYVRCFLPGPGS